MVNKGQSSLMTNKKHGLGAKHASSYVLGGGNLYINATSMYVKKKQLECGTMPNVMATLLNIGGALCSTPQTLADTHY